MFSTQAGWGPGRAEPSGQFHAPLGLQPQATQLSSEHVVSTWPGGMERGRDPWTLHFPPSPPSATETKRCKSHQPKVGKQILVGRVTSTMGCSGSGQQAGVVDVDIVPLS